MVFERVPERVGQPYLVLAFFVLPATAVVLSGGTRPVPPVSRALFIALVVHHSLFLAVSVLD